MRPKITSCKSVARSLRYNEQKVDRGTAECLTAANFLKDRERLTVEEKLHCFERRMQLNERVSTNLHITLNFDPRDNLSNERMRQIAKMYMDDIGFGRQPYLVYRHHDAGHPHCHIVSTHIRSDGSPIDLYNIGRNQSEQARQHIEKEFELVTAEKKQELRHNERLLREEDRQRRIRMGLPEQQTDGVRKVIYGERTLARSMSDVVEHVFGKYNYTSLDELNMALRVYNVEAYRGGEGTRLFQNRGLLYRALDENGQYIGVPLKASFFDCRPTLDNLEKKFALNQLQRLEASQHARVYANFHLLGERSSLEDVAANLLMDGILMRLQRNEKGRCSEVYYIDVRNRCVVRGDVLGERCGPEAIQRVIDREQKLRQELALMEEHGHRHRLRQSL